MGDGVDRASCLFKTYSVEATRRQIACDNTGDGNLVFDVEKELVEVDVDESYVDNGVRDSVVDETLNDVDNSIICLVSW